MDWKDKNIERLLKAFLVLKTETEVRSFLRDLMTEKEILEFSKRLRAAEMLNQGQIYTEIEEETGLSSTTVARVAKWLKSTEGGYKGVIAKLNHHHNPNQSRRGLS